MAVIRVIRTTKPQSVAFGNSLIRYISIVVPRVHCLTARLLMTDEVKTVLGSHSALRYVTRNGAETTEGLVLKTVISDQPSPTRCLSRQTQITGLFRLPTSKAVGAALSVNNTPD